MKTTLQVDDETYEKFRLAVRRKYGTVRNNLGNALNDALRHWTEKNERK